MLGGRLAKRQRPEGEPLGASGSGCRSAKIAKGFGTVLPEHKSLKIHWLRRVPEREGPGAKEQGTPPLEQLVILAVTGEETRSGLPPFMV